MGGLGRERYFGVISPALTREYADRNIKSLYNEF